jgi:hypothetical protein
MGTMHLPLLAALAVAAGPGPSPRVVEEIVAVVRNPPGAAPRVVTRTKLEEEARIALVSRGGAAAATGPLDAEALRAALEWLLDQMLLADEAARLKLDDVDGADVEEALRRFRARFEDAGAYARFLSATELGEEELSVTLARMVRVELYVQSRVGRAGRVSDDEVERYLRAKGAAPASPAAREAVRAQLAEERTARGVKELLADLRARADVRVLTPPAGEGS